MVDIRCCRRGWRSLIVHLPIHKWHKDAPPGLLEHERRTSPSASIGGLCAMGGHWNLPCGAHVSDQKCNTIDQSASVHSELESIQELSFCSHHDELSIRGHAHEVDPSTGTCTHVPRSGHRYYSRTNVRRHVYEETHAIHGLVTVMPMPVIVCVPRQRTVMDIFHRQYPVRRPTTDDTVVISLGTSPRHSHQLPSWSISLAIPQCW